MDRTIIVTWLATEIDVSQGYIGQRSYIEKRSLGGRVDKSHLPFQVHAEIFEKIFRRSIVLKKQPGVGQNQLRLHPAARQEDVE